MLDQTVKFFTFSIGSDDTSLYVGNWLVKLYRATVNYGFLIATRYGIANEYTGIYTRSLRNGVWESFQRLAYAIPPTWYNLPIVNTELTAYRINAYTKDQFGRVTVRLGVKSVTEEGIWVSGPINISNLPVGFRPSLQYGNIFYGSSNGVPVAISVNEGGAINVSTLYLSNDHNDRPNFYNISTEFSFYSV